MLTLAQAAAMTGMNRSSILRAIKRGALTGTRTITTSGTSTAPSWRVPSRLRLRSPSSRPRTPTPTRWPLTSSPSPRNASPSLRNASKK